MKYESYIFDFDGTIADTLDEGVRIYNVLADRYGLLKVTPEELPKLRHMGIGPLFDHLGISTHKAPQILYQATRMLKSKIGQLPLIQGMKEILPELSHKTNQLGILTSNSEENVHLFLQTHGLENLFAFVSSTSKLTGKARHLRKIIKSHNVAAEKLLYIGDEIRDIKAAKKAGVDIAAVAWGFNSPESLMAQNPDYMLHNPIELIDINSSHGNGT